MHRSPEANAGDAAAGVHPGKRTLTQSLGAHRAVQAKPTPGGVEEPAASSSAATAAVDDPFALHLQEAGVKSGVDVNAATGAAVDPHAATGATPDPSPPNVRSLQRGSPGTPIAQTDAQTLQTHMQHQARIGQRGHDYVVDTTYDYDIYAGEWHHAGGTGEPPRYGFYNVQGRAQLWGRPEAPLEFHMQQLRAPRPRGVALSSPAHAEGGAAVDPHAATGAAVAAGDPHAPPPAVDAHAATGAAVDPHAATGVDANAGRAPAAPPNPGGAPDPSPPNVRSLQRGSPGTPIAQTDAQTLRGHMEHQARIGQRGHDYVVDTTYDYDIYAGEWHHAGGTGEPPRYGFYNVQGRAQLWGRPEAPLEFHMQQLRAPRPRGVALSSPAHAEGGAAVDPHAATGAAVDPHAATGAAVDAHGPTLHGGAHPHGARGAAPVAEVEAPTVPVEAGGSRALRGVGHVGGAAAGAYGTYEGVRQMQHAAALARQGHTGEAVSHGTEGALNATSGAMTVVGEVGAVAGVEGAAAVGTAAAPLAVAAGTIAADRAGDEHARNTGVMGRRHGVASGRGMRPHPDGGHNPEHNQDFGDVAESAGHAVERRTGSVVAGAVATAAARVHLIPIAATYGVRQTLGDSGGRSDTTDIEAQDQEQRGAPIAEASPAVRAARERLRAQHRAQAAAQHAATEQARREREAQTGVVAHREGMPITETEVNQRAMAVMREWNLQWGANIADPDLMEHARRVAREQLQLERAGIH